MIVFYNLHNVPKNINYPDIYFTPEYGKACEYSDNAIWELCQYKDLIYVYLKKNYTFEKITYYDLITPYGYSGYFYEKEETLEEFIPIFREEAKKKKYLTEVIRQNPYLNINISNYYETIVNKTTLGIKLDNFKTFDDYLNNTHRDNKRGYNLAMKSKLISLLKPFNLESYEEFKLIYENTMHNLNSTEYYYFNDNYYNALFDMKEMIYFMNIYKDNMLIASCMLFKFKTFLHYHLGGSLLEFRNLRPNNLLHCNVIKYGMQNNYNLYHLGGGLKDNDSLFEFKNKIANTKFNYTIYKNVLIKEIYDKIKQVSPENDSFYPIHRKY
jgi:hypothetical protein